MTYWTVCSLDGETEISQVTAFAEESEALEAMGEWELRVGPAQVHQTVGDQIILGRRRWLAIPVQLDGFVFLHTKEIFRGCDWCDGAKSERVDWVNGPLGRYCSEDCQVSHEESEIAERLAC